MACSGCEAARKAIKRAVSTLSVDATKEAARLTYNAVTENAGRRLVMTRFQRPKS